VFSGYHSSLLTLRVSKASAIGRDAPDFSAKNPGPHGTRLTSTCGGIPPVVDAPILTAVALRLRNTQLLNSRFGLVWSRELMPVP